MAFPPNGLVISKQKEQEKQLEQNKLCTCFTGDNMLSHINVYRMLSKSHWSKYTNMNQSSIRPITHLQLRPLTQMYRQYSSSWPTESGKHLVEFSILTVVVIRSGYFSKYLRLPWTKNVNKTPEVIFLPRIFHIHEWLEVAMNVIVSQQVFFSSRKVNIRKKYWKVRVNFT